MHKNIKTGHGGMVDVEFLVQFLQLQHGRQHTEIRSRNTLDALQALQDSKLLSGEDANRLANGYKFLRRLENKLRLVHDQSINQLSSEPAYLNKLAKHLGYQPDGTRNPEQQLEKDYLLITENIRTIFENTLGGQPR